jgi:hypothetical protein
VIVFSPLTSSIAGSSGRGRQGAKAHPSHGAARSVFRQAESATLGDCVRAGTVDNRCLRTWLGPGETDIP